MLKCAEQFWNKGQSSANLESTSLTSSRYGDPNGDMKNYYQTSDFIQYRKLQIDPFSNNES
jgi:hypothetical protein